MSRFGPGRGELWFRLLASLAGLAMLGGVIALRGLPAGPALVEVVGVGGAFFGGSAALAGWKLWKGRR